MTHYKSTFFIIIWLTFFCFSPTPTKAINDIRKAENIEKSHQINDSLPFYVAQDSDSEATESQKTNKKKSKDSKIPKSVRSILKALGGRKILFILSIMSVLVTGTAVFILVKIFDDNQPKDLDEEDLSSEEIPEGTSPDLETQYSNLNSEEWPVTPENSSVPHTQMANIDNSPDFSVSPKPKQEELNTNTHIQVSQDIPQTNHQDIEVETLPIVDSNSPIDLHKNNNYESKETEVNLSEVTDKNSIVEDASHITRQNNYPVPQINIVDQLIGELDNFDPNKRHQAIWELGQKGDSRAVQPLVNLLIDSDSKQQSLILATLSEISTRTLKPMSRALAISLQNDNAEVRKNAIRDLTRIYDLIIQTTNLLQQAEYDPDPEVEQTAKWALDQLNRIRPR
ncbi:MAG: HEAT repeat domain-containing protein [Trichodesmium sp.]